LPNSNTQEQKIVSLQIVNGNDCVLARQRAKQIASLLGFENQDQTRIATAVSEIARNAFEYSGGGQVMFTIQRGTVSEMWAIISDHGHGIPHLEEIWSGTYRSKAGLGLGLIGAKQLVDHFDIETSASGTIVRLGKRLTRTAKPVPEMRELLDRVGQLSISDPRLQLRHENQELLELLEVLRSREAELERVNSELEETNRGVLALYRELEDKAESLRQASEAKSRFLSAVSHELRTPLNAIASLSQLLLDRIDGNLTPEQAKQIHFVLRSANGLSEMVTELLDLAKIEAGKTEIKITALAVGEVFSALRGMFRPLSFNDRVKLIFADGLSTFLIRTDQDKLAQILRNLISNALKFTETGSVTVSAREEEGDRIVFSVADTGIEIAPEHRDTVFEEWGQVSSAQKGIHRGSGLGLPLSRRLADLLRGSLHFDSIVDHGTTFFLSLPSGAARVMPDPVSAAPSRRVILMVGIKGEIRQVISNLLLNAIDAMQPGGSLAFRITEGEHGMLVLSAQDNGSGIPSKHLQEIFEPFFTTKAGIGTGLGLWVSNNIIQKHGGSIEVESSTAVDASGTTFLVRLPVSSSMEQQAKSL